MSKSLDKILQDANLNSKTLKALAENSFDSILITDATARTKILYANKAFKKVIARLSETLSSGGRFEGKAINYKKNGTPFLMHWRVVPVKVGKNTKVWLAIQRETFSL